MTMKHEREQETDQQRRAGDDDVAEKLDPMAAGWQTALAKDVDGDDDDASADEVARGEDLSTGRSEENADRR